MYTISMYAEFKKTTPQATILMPGGAMINGMHGLWVGLQASVMSLGFMVFILVV